MANVLHLHGDEPCRGTKCAPRTPRRITKEEFESAGINPRQGDEAQGVCPDSGMDLYQCVVGPCDCFMETAMISNYIDSCQRELIRQSKSKKEAS